MYLYLQCDLIFVIYGIVIFLISGDSFINLNIDQHLL